MWIQQYIYISTSSFPLGPTSSIAFSSRLVVFPEEYVWFILEWTTSLDTSSSTLFVCRSTSPRTSSYVITECHVRLLLNVELRNYNYVISRHLVWCGPVSIRACVPNLVAVRRSCRKGGGDRPTEPTHYETFTSMSGTILPTMCQIVVVIK